MLLNSIKGGIGKLTFQVVDYKRYSLSKLPLCLENVTTVTKETLSDDAGMNSRKNPYKRHRFSPEIIQYAVWL
jgi:hypothetical protein